MYCRLANGDADFDQTWSLIAVVSVVSIDDDGDDSSQVDSLPP